MPGSSRANARIGYQAPSSLGHNVVGYTLESFCVRANHLEPEDRISKQYVEEGGTDVEHVSYRVSTYCTPYFAAHLTKVNSAPIS